MRRADCREHASLARELLATQWRGSSSRTALGPVGDIARHERALLIDSSITEDHSLLVQCDKDTKMPSPYITRGAAIEASRRMPFGAMEAQMLVAFIETSAKNHLDIQLDLDLVQSDRDLQGMFAAGLILLRSQQLNRRFMFVKVDAGRGFFGGKKSHISSFIGDPFLDEYLPGPSFGSLGGALTSINNIYRGEGLLHGSSI